MAADATVDTAPLFGTFMRVGLFVPCYIDQFYPDVAIATLELLEAQGISPIIPSAPTCCGQPMANTGCVSAAKPLAEQFVAAFADCDYVVCPSGSCTAMIRHHYGNLVGDNAVRERTFELCEFFVDVLKATPMPAAFNYKVGLHQSCHGLRELGLGSPSELRRTTPNKVHNLLADIPGIDFVELSRPDECCGFGGTFAVAEEAVSVMMGCDRLDDHIAAGAEVMVSADMSCLMHLDGLARRQQCRLATMHVAQVLAGRQPRFRTTQLEVTAK